MASVDEVTLCIEGDDVVVEQPALLDDRTARMFFRSILGATPTETGWRCPRRRSALSALVVRVNTYLESRGWRVARAGIADEAVTREIERRRSFQRTRERALRLRDGQPSITCEDLLGRLATIGWDARARTLLPHQVQGAIHGLTAANAANFSVPGSGKTATTLAIAAGHLSAGTAEVVVVVGPLACFAPWETEASAALPGRFRVRRVRGSASERRSCYGEACAFDLLLTSYASAAADRNALCHLCQSFRVVLVVDESHRIKRFHGGLWAPALCEVAKYARVRLILTGTPMPQSGRDLYSQLNVLWPGGELTGARDDFAVRVEKDFTSVVRDVRPFVTRTPKSALGLPEYEVHRHDVPIAGTQDEIYELIEGRFRRLVEDAARWDDKLAALRRGRPIRLLQAACNPMLFNRDDRYYGVPRLQGGQRTLMERLAHYGQGEFPAKSIAALALVSEIVSRGQKVVCWSNFLANLDHFARLVRERTGAPCFQVDGRVPAGDDMPDDRFGAPRSNASDEDTRERVIEAFLDTPGGAVLVTNPASCSESISLHRSCHHAVYLDRTYDSALYLQSIDRIHRLGLPKGVTVHVHLLLATCRGRSTIDHLADASLRRKDVRMRELLEGAEWLPIAISDNPLDAAEGTREDLEELLRFLLGEGG